MKQTRLIAVDTSANGISLKAKTLDEIVAQRLPIREHAIVLVLFAHSQRGIEQSLWVYGNKGVPLLGDANNVEATIKTAAAFGADTFLGDIASLTASASNGLPSSVTQIVIVDSDVEFVFPKELNAHYECTYVVQRSGE